MNIPKDYWWEWVNYREIPHIALEGQPIKAWVGYWIDLLSYPVIRIPCTFTENDLAVNPAVGEEVKRIGLEVLEQEVMEQNKREATLEG